VDKIIGKEEMCEDPLKSWVFLNSIFE